MNIKGIVRNLVPFAQTADAVAAKNRTETGSASDRDPNGKQEQAEEQTPRHLTPEEFEEVIKYLESLQGVKDNRLTVHLEETDGIKVIYVKDLDGKVVRRLAEVDCAMMLRNKDAAEKKKSGQLLNKSA